MSLPTILTCAEPAEGAATRHRHAVVAIDVSGSTSGVRRYWETVRRVAIGAQREHDAVDFVEWSHRASTTFASRVYDMCANLRGPGGDTNPASFVPLVRAAHEDELKSFQNVQTRLIVVTDGEINTNYVDEAAKLVRELPAGTFEAADVHIVHDGSYGAELDASVASAFVRDVPHTITTYGLSDGEGKSVCVTQADIDALETIDSIQTYEEFERAIPVLERVLESRLMGTDGDAKLHRKLVEMRARLVRVMADRPGAKGAAAELTRAVDACFPPGALAACRRLAHDYYDGGDDVEETLETRIARLISAAAGFMRHDFAMRGLSGRVQRARHVHEAPPDMTPQEVDPAHDAWTCPIMLEAAAPFVLLGVNEAASEIPWSDDEADDEADIHNDDKVAFTFLTKSPMFYPRDPHTNHLPLLHGMTKHAHESVLNCPLAFLTQQRAMHELKGCIDHAVSQVAFQGLCTSAERVSPLTRRKLMGAVSFGLSEEHAAFTDAALAHLFFGGRVVGNRDLWFAVFLESLETVRYMEDAVKDAARAHMRWRMQNRTAPAGLWGVATAVTTRVSLEAALFFATHCAVAHARDRVYYDRFRDPMRHHAFNAPAMFKLLDELGRVPVTREAREYANRVKLTYSLLSAVKRNADATKAEVRALFQNHTRTKRNEIVFLDGKAAAPQGSSAFLGTLIRASPREEVVAAYKRVSPSLSAGSIPIPLTANGDTDATGDNDDSLLTHEKVWAYADYAREEVLETQKCAICPFTMRPYYRLRDHKTWKTAAVATYGISPDKVFPAARLYGDFVMQKKRFPDADELLVFAADAMRRSVARNNPSTLPSAARAFIEATLRDFDAALAEAGLGAKGASAVKTFEERFRASHDVTARVQMEQGVLV